MIWITIVKNFFFKNKFMIYAMIISMIICLFGGFYSGWKIKSLFQTSANMKVIENDIEKIEEQDEVDSISYDSDSFRNGILRNGRL